MYRLANYGKKPPLKHMLKSTLLPKYGIQGITYLLLYILQLIAGKTTRIERGADMITAIKEARKRKSEKLKLLKSIFLAFFEVTNKESLNTIIEQKEALITTLKKELPTIYMVLVEERDGHMAKQIITLPNKRIMAIVGAGHIHGILVNLRKLT